MEAKGVAPPTPGHTAPVGVELATSEAVVAWVESMGYESVTVAGGGDGETYGKVIVDMGGDDMYSLCFTEEELVDEANFLRKPASPRITDVPEAAKSLDLSKIPLRRKGEFWATRQGRPTQVSVRIICSTQAVLPQHAAQRRPRAVHHPPSHRGSADQQSWSAAGRWGTPKACIQLCTTFWSVVAWSLLKRS